MEAEVSFTNFILFDLRKPLQYGTIESPQEFVIVDSRLEARDAVVHPFSTNFMVKLYTHQGATTIFVDMIFQVR